MLHTVPDFELALNGMRAEFGLAPIDQATIEPMVGKGSEKLIRDVLALDYDAARVDAVFDAGDGGLPAPLPGHQRRAQPRCTRT